MKFNDAFGQLVAKYGDSASLTFYRGVTSEGKVFNSITAHAKDTCAMADSYEAALAALDAKLSTAIIPEPPGFCECSGPCNCDELTEHEREAKLF